MKRAKLSLICMLSLGILGFGYVNAYATSGIKAVLESRNTNLSNSREVEVILRLDNYEKIDKGVNVYKATLEYDKNVFRIF